MIAYNDMVYLGVSALVSGGIGLLFDLGLSLSTITTLMGCAFFVGAAYWLIVYKRYKEILD